MNLRYRISNRLNIAVAAITIIAFTVVSANATVLFYEGFEAPGGTALADLATPLGGSGPWIDTSSGSVAGYMVVRHNGSPVNQNWTGIPYGGNPPSGFPQNGGFLEGEYITNHNEGHITLAASVTSTFVDGAVTWVSCVAANTPDAAHPTDLNHNKPNLAIGSGELLDDRAREVSGQAIGAGCRYNNYQDLRAAYWIEDPAAEDYHYSEAGLPTLTPQQLIVFKIEWSDTGNDTVSVANFDLSLPYLGLAEVDFNNASPVTISADLDQDTFDTLSFHGSRMNIDEIRIATTFADVVGGAFVSNPYVTALVAALTELKDHVDGTITLSSSELATHKATIDDLKVYFESSEDVILAAFDLVETYDATMGPLWVDGVKRWPDWDVRLVTEDNIHWTIYHVMQYLMDYTYTAENLASYESILGSFKFGSADYFPGHVDPPTDPEVIHTAKINASFPKTFGHHTMHWENRPARKCTGAYLAPGTVATVTVPPSMVNAGYQIRVGAHALDVSNKPFMKRLGRSSLAYDITSTETKVTNPLGGGIYIEVPYLADAGVADIQIKNTVRAPYYSYNTVTGDMTTLSDWQNTERNLQVPWADFQSEKFMMQVPTSWIYALDDPVTLMADWDKAIDAANDLMGFDHDRGKETSYDQVDVIIDAGAFSPGYPTCNNTYDPHAAYDGYRNSYLVRGPQYAPNHHFHELGHNYLFQKFSGEVESVVNLIHVPVWHRKFGYDLDMAFRTSRGYNNNQYITLDTTAVCWMMCQNFKNRQPMATPEKQYQLKGHAKFVEIARLFGWDVLGDYWRSFNDDYENGVSYSTSDDSLLLRLSKSVGYDIRPLFHFWGLPPKYASSLQAAFAAENLPASSKIFDTLEKYKSLVPADIAAYQDFAFNWWKQRPTVDGYTTEYDHAMLWDTYDQAYADVIRNNVQNVIDLYFPEGRPGLDIGSDKITWSGKAVQMNPVFSGGYSAESFAWSAEPADGVVFTPNANVETPTVTITKATSNSLVVTIALVTDGAVGQMEDSMTLDLYDTACKAAAGKGLSVNYPADIDGNCIIDLRDFAVLAADWLDNGLLNEPLKIQLQ